MSKLIQLKDNEGNVFPKYIEKYSNNEQKIGLWVDGKPIYKKVKIIDPLAYNTVNTNLSVFEIKNVENIVKMDCFLFNSARTACYKMPLNDNSNKKTRCIFDFSNNNIVFFSQDTWSNGKLITIIEYTKTTD